MKRQQTPKTNLLRLALAMMAWLGCVCVGTFVDAAEVNQQLSTREAYVGAPIVFVIEIVNAEDFERPVLPKIDGIEIASAGPPVETSQVTIINGRRSQKNSVRYQFLLTPLRVGSFEIPAFELEIDGEVVQTHPETFVVTTSETGDLLFAELTSDEKVYVGQPLDTRLKIYMKPFVDRDLNIQLTEGNMWDMISTRSSWGSFAERMVEMNNRNQRPGGKEVLHDDGSGNQRSYYMYEIQAEIYPTRAGKIDASDTKIIVDYPTKLGRSRDPFGGMLGMSPFAEDFFGRNRLAVVESRPIVAEVRVEGTEILPIPTTGRPDDYRGAVGKYKIVAEAASTKVKAGDTIDLTLGIVGTGPMEMVQAPPLAELPALSDFKISNDPLAGYVRDDAKFFAAKIRPRQAGITEIPPIPFTFFNPDTEAFETTYSEGIPIVVEPADTLALDAIVSAQNKNTVGVESNAETDAELQNDLGNNHAQSVLVSQPHSAASPGWIAWLVVPPCIWLCTWLGCNLGSLGSMVAILRSPRTLCNRSLIRARTADGIRSALQIYIHRTFRSKNSDHSSEAAVGAIRSAGFYPLAAEVESFFNVLPAAESAPTEDAGKLSSLKEDAMDLVGRIADARRSGFRSTPREKTGGNNGVGKSSAIARSVLLAIGLTLATSNLVMADAIQTTPAELSPAQCEIILKEAGEIYDRARTSKEADSLEAQELFSAAAAKYQTLVDTGIRNPDLYVNLANAYLQSGQVGRAIANYQRAKMLQPNHRQANANLAIAEAATVAEVVSTTPSFSMARIFQSIESFNTTLYEWVGGTIITCFIAVSSVAFWGIAVGRTLRWPWVRWSWAALPLLVMFASTASAILMVNSSSKNVAFVVENAIGLRSGDGENFSTVATIEKAQGRAVRVTSQRGGWIQVETQDGQRGWLPADAIEQLKY